MSKLLAEIIRERKNKALDYEEYLKKIAALASRVHEGKTEDTPESIRTPAQKALFNNLGKDEGLALKIHDRVLNVKPDGWKGNEPKERVIKQALYEILKDVDEVERIFAIIKQQGEY